MLIYGDDTVWTPAENRYETMPYRRVGESGLKLPAVSLGLWHNFGDDKPVAGMRATLRRAFDLGITHFDLANNYGPPAGSAELNFGRILKEDFAGHRHELVISTKAGWDMWPGPYGDVGGSRQYLVTSLDQSLERMGLDHVDVFYHHRPDPRRRSRRPCGHWTTSCAPVAPRTWASPPTVRTSHSRRSGSCASWAPRW